MLVSSASSVASAQLNEEAWLQRRALIDDVGRLTIPVLGRFLIEEELAV